MDEQLNRMAGVSLAAKIFTVQAGAISGVYSPLHAPASAATGRSRYAAIFSR